MAVAQFILTVKNKIMKRIIRLTERDLTKIVRRIIRENEDEEDDGIDFNFDFGGPKDLTALIEGITYLIDDSEDVNDFEMKLEQFTNDNQKDFNNLTDDDRNRLDRFINSVMTRHNFKTGEDDDQTSEYTSYDKPSKYDPQYSQDPRERYDHGGSQSGH